MKQSKKIILTGMNQDTGFTKYKILCKECNKLVSLTWYLKQLKGKGKKHTISNFWHLEAKTYAQ